VPYDAVGPGLRRRKARDVARPALGLVVHLDGEFAQHGIAVEELDREGFVVCGLRRKPVEDDDAVWRVAADRGLRAALGLLARRESRPPQRRPRRKDEELRREDRVAVLVQRRQVVEYPERPTLGRDDEVLVLDREVRNRNDGQVLLKRPPRL